MTNVVITGCSRGIGYELAKQFAASGNFKIIGLSRNAAALVELQKELGSSLFSPLSFDLIEISEKGDWLFNKIAEIVPCVDILINNAGILYNKPLNLFSQKEIEQQFMVNAIAPGILINKLMPLLLKCGHAHVVNIGSMGGFQGSAKFSGLAWYSSSKAAIACLTECLAQEYKNSPVAFNCLALGAAQTEMLEQAFPGYKANLSAAEMARFIISFAVEAHKVMNGKIIPVALSNP